MQEPSPGRTSLFSCLPALNSSSKPLPSLLAHPPSCSPGVPKSLGNQNLVFCKPVCRLIHFFLIVEMLLVSHLPVCQPWGPARPGGGSTMCHGDSSLVPRQSIASVRKGATAQDHSLPPQPVLPCSYSTPASIHTFRLVLSISFPVNTHLCCIFLRNLVEPAGFGIAVTTSSV